MAHLYFSAKTSFTLSAVQSVSLTIGVKVKLLILVFNFQAIVLGMGLQHKSVDKLEVNVCGYSVSLQCAKL